MRLPAFFRAACELARRGTGQRMTRTVAPYGTWVAPVSVELMTQATIGLGSLSVEGQDLYWLEARPSESGRTVLCCRRANGEIDDITPAPINVGSRVHEYGGGAYAVAAGLVVFSERTDGSAGETPQAIVQPEWAADGALYFCSDQTGWWNLYVLRDGKIEPLAPVEAEIGGPRWVFRQRYYDFLPGRIVAAIVRNGIRSAAAVVDGKITPLDIGQVQEWRWPCLYRNTSCRAAVRLCIARMSAAAPSIISSAASAVVPQDSISLGEPIEFPARGGVAHAFWYPPKNRDTKGPAGELPPLVVLSHGGPTSMTTNSFSLGIQWWTTRGFGVVDVNYGGSAGFGRAYRERLYGQCGVVDVEDCTAAAKHLAGEGLVDGARLVIRGGSAGGFATLAALTSLDLFKAGASFYGVGDLMLLAEDTHKFESRYLDWLIGPLPQAQALYSERSPVNHVGRLACPVIFFQGEPTRRCRPIRRKPWSRR